MHTEKIRISFSKMCGHDSLATPNRHSREQKRIKSRMQKTNCFPDNNCDKYKQAHWAERKWLLTPKRNWTFDRHRLGNASRNKVTHFNVARNILFIFFFRRTRSISYKIQARNLSITIYDVCMCLCIAGGEDSGGKWKEPKDIVK